MTTVDVRLGIDLCGTCEARECDEIAAPLLSQLQDGSYGEMSVMPLPLTIAEWRSEHRTARKRADRAASRGYRAHELTRERWEDDIYAINTSTDWRQGRPMSPGYREFQKFSRLPKYACPRHAIRCTGVWTSGSTLVAYLVMIRAGELALVSQILGHADHLENEVMWLLFEHALEREIAADPEALVVYNRHDSGTDGLRWFKERLGFEAVPVEWLP